MYFFTVKHQSPSGSGESNLANAGALDSKFERRVISNITNNAISTTSETIDRENISEHSKNKDIDISKSLVAYREKNKDKVILATLNINSIRNKFSSLTEIISQNIDVLVIQETKIDSSFPEGQFQLPGYKNPYCKDRDSHGGGVLVYVRDDIPSKEVKTFTIGEGTEGMFIELNFRKSKGLLIAAYKLPDISKTICLDMISKALHFYSGKYQNFILMGI